MLIFLTNIDDNAFYGCKGFTSLELSYDIKHIGKNAFSCRTGLKGNLTIHVSADMEYGAFSFCTEFNGSLRIPNNITTEFCGIILIYPTKTYNPSSSQKLSFSQSFTEPITNIPTPEPTISPSDDDSKSKKLSKIQLILIIVGCCAFIILTTIIVFIIIKKKSWKDYNYSESLVSGSSDLYTMNSTK